MKGSKKYFLFLIVLLAINLIAPAIPMAKAQTKALAEIVDNYENEDYIAIKEKTIRNPTLNAMELNYSIYKDRYEDEGYFYTTNMLSERHMSLSTLMTNSILDKGIITVQFSNDNYTWVNQSGQPGNDSLIDGYDSLDLRNLNFENLYMRFNFTRGGFFKTPRLYQIKITGHNPGNGDFVCVPQFFNASSIEVIVGTLNDGNLDSTYFVDGDWYNVSEVTGPPGLDIRVNFTDVGEGCGCFEFYQTYLGHSQHEIEVQIWNFTSTAWNMIGPVFYNETANWACIGLGHYYKHFFNEGNLYARFYHEDIGHPTHELQIDRIDLAVVQEHECPLAPPVDDYSIIFLAIGLILMLAIAFLYAKDK